MNNLIKNNASSIFIIGEINPDLCSNIITDIFETDWEKKKARDLIVFISSSGGHLHQCFAVIDAIDFVRDTYNIRVTTVGLGQVASAGFFIFINGDKRIIFPNCMVFVHEHSLEATTMRYYSDIKKDDRDQDKIYSMYINYTMKRLEISKRKAKMLFKKDRYLTLKELVDYNIINTLSMKEKNNNGK